MTHDEQLASLIAEELHDARVHEAALRSNTAQSMHDCFDAADHYRYLCETGWTPEPCK